MWPELFALSISWSLVRLLFLKSGSGAERIANRQLIPMTEFCLFCTQWVILFAKGVVSSILIGDVPFQLPWSLVFFYPMQIWPFSEQWIFQHELRNITLSFRMANKSWGKKQLNSINDGQVQLTLEACFSTHLLHPLIPTLSKLFFQSTDRVIPFGQIKIRFSHLAEGVLQSRNGCERVNDGFWSSWVCEEER